MDLGTTITYTVSKTKWRDTDNTPRILEPKLISMTVWTPYYTYKSAPNVSEILDDDLFITFIEGNRVRRISKAYIICTECEFDSDVKVDDFILPSNP